MLHFSGRFRFVLAIVAVCCFLGCGGNKDEKSPENKTLSPKENGSEAQSKSVTDSQKQSEGNAQSGESAPITARILGNWEGDVQIEDEEFQSFIKGQGVPDEAAPQLKSRLQNARFYFSFEDGGTGIAGTLMESRYDADQINWKLTSESRNDGRIETTSKTDGTPEGDMDITFKDAETFLGKPVREEDNPGAFPPFQIQFKKVKQLPREIVQDAETQPRSGDKRE